MSARALLLALLPCLGGCYASNVVAPEARTVEVSRPRITWRPASARDLSGFWESTEVTGASAGALLKAYYWFDPAGAYSGAALVVGEERPRFLTLAEDGRWTLDEAGLDLHDGGDPVQASAAPGHLKLVTADSAIVFRAVTLE